MSRKVRYSVIYAPAREGGYGAYFPAFPEITVWYPTLKQCREAAREALEIHLKGLRALGARLPHERNIVRSAVRVEVG